MVLKSAALALIAAAALSSVAAARETIVGDWRHEDGVCQLMDGAMTIGPKFIIGDSHKCEFDTVSRTGDVVTWKGQCGWPENPQPSTVVARLVGKRLWVAYDGGDNGPFVRCDR